MQIGRSIEVKAARFCDAAERLRYLRRALRCQHARQTSASAIVGVALTGFVLMASNSVRSPVPAQIQPTQKYAIELRQTPEKAWIVEQNSRFSIYSNGLQIRADYTIPSTPRSFRRLSRRTLVTSEPLTVPVGIVFHTTESQLLPMEAAQNGSLLRTREDLLRHVREGRLYNFVIDRFGQVFRIVPEDQVAYHAGNSVWADEDFIYEGLNESFLGVSFETRTGPASEVTAAQIHSGRMLTDILRNTYDIPETNCVTHAQVSVNPENMRIGYHTDWAANFPFRELGLSTGYNASIAAVAVFGFDYDDGFIQSIGGYPWPGLTLATQTTVREAQQQNVSVAVYREHLQQQYRNLRSRFHEHTTAGSRT